ncbi:transcription elongation factor GreA [Candidatus Uhrbacteria bacterium]|nr:transcription elongation factor GreA [Candidatus Uhrbacteria bacterium]
MASEPVQVTQEGLEKLKQELQYLKSVKRKEIAERLEAAKALGDLSENADYQQAKEDSAWTEGRVNELGGLISRAVIAGAPTAGIVSIGSTVTVSSGAQNRVFTIVGATEADPSHGKISADSPIGAALLGFKEGEDVLINTPAGAVRYKVVKIE